MKADLPTDVQIDTLLSKRDTVDREITQIINTFENNKNRYKSSVLMVMNIFSGITVNKEVTNVVDKALSDLNGQPSKYSRLIILDRLALGRKYGFATDEIKRRFKAQIQQIRSQLDIAIESPIQSLKGLKPIATSSTQS